MKCNTNTTKPELKMKTVLKVKSANLDEFVKKVYKADCPEEFSSVDAELMEEGLTMSLTVKRGKMTEEEKDTLRDFKDGNWRVSGMVEVLMHDLANMNVIPEGRYVIKFD